MAGVESERLRLVAVSVTTSLRARFGSPEHGCCRDSRGQGDSFRSAPTCRSPCCEGSSEANPCKPDKVITILETSLPAAQVQVLSAALRAVQLESVSEPEHKATEGLSEVSVSAPTAACDSQQALSAASPQRQLSVAGILHSTVSICPLHSHEGVTEITKLHSLLLIYPGRDDKWQT